MKTPFYLFVLILLMLSVFSCSNLKETEAQHFISEYSDTFQKLRYTAVKASWLANTDIKEEHTEKEIETGKALVEFTGKKDNIEKAKELLKFKDQLEPLTVKQIESIIYKAAHGPGTIPEITAKLVEADAKQNEALYAFDFKLKNGKKVSANDIDKLLREEKNVKNRLEVWNASKEVGKGLKDGLENLKQLRNSVAKEMGYNSFFDLEVADYGMKSDEMVELMEKVYSELKPLYAQLYTWVKYKLAERYNQPVPDKMPAHWLPNRWSQEWPGIVEGVDLDPLFTNKKPEWLVEQGEKFYVSMGFPKLPQVFWDESDLYPAPADGSRKKNSHASAWHPNLEDDVRSLMSVENNSKWFGTTHHELGHIYYYMSYTNPEVPLLLRGGANRGFHEGIGELITIASLQTPYLREIGVLPEEMKIDKIKWLLKEALDNVIFIPWSAGVMTHFEYELYEKNLSKDQFNKRWWELVEKYQGIVPPKKRGEEYCDAATKTHINNDPAQYYDYAVAKLLQYQFHDYICKNILKTSPNEANYYNNKEVGAYLKSILSKGKTGDWRKLLKEKTGEELSARAMLSYFQPLIDFLEKENKGRKIGF